MNVDQLITKYGSTIAKQLQIATTQVYGTLLWYVRIHAIVQIITIGLTIIVCGICLRFLLPVLIKKTSQWMRDTDGFLIMIYVFGVVLGGLALVGVYNLFFYISDLTVQIIFPNYWILEQVINKVTGN